MRAGRRVALTRRTLSACVPAGLALKADQLVVTHRFHFVKDVAAPSASAATDADAQP
jgi:hypothetical protein